MEEKKKKSKNTLKYCVIKDIEIMNSKTEFKDNSKNIVFQNMYSQANCQKIYKQRRFFPNSGLKN